MLDHLDRLYMSYPYHILKKKKKNFRIRSLLTSFFFEKKNWNVLNFIIIFNLKNSVRIPIILLELFFKGFFHQLYIFFLWSIVSSFVYFRCNFYIHENLDTDHSHPFFFIRKKLIRTVKKRGGDDRYPGSGDESNIKMILLLFVIDIYYK